MQAKVGDILFYYDEGLIEFGCLIRRIAIGEENCSAPEKPGSYSREQFVELLKTANLNEHNGKGDPGRRDYSLHEDITEIELLERDEKSLKILLPLKSRLDYTPEQVRAAYGYQIAAGYDRLSIATDSEDATKRCYVKGGIRADGSEDDLDTDEALRELECFRIGDYCTSQCF